MIANNIPLTISEVDLNEPAPSPFLAGTRIQFCWDSTSLGWLKTCPRLYEYTMLEGWSPLHESVHLRFGQEFHKALEDYDRLKASGSTHASAMREALWALAERTSGWNPDQDTKAGRYKNRTTLFSLVINYLDFYNRDEAKTLQLKDGHPAVELSFRFELDWGPQSTRKVILENGIEAEETRDDVPYLLCGHLDRVVEFANSVFVMDRKTATATLTDYYFDQYEPHNQMTLYTLAAQVILDSPVRGVIIDAAQILLEEPNRFVRGITHRTPDQIQEWLDDLRVWLSIAEQYATAGHWPMNDTSCDKFGGCKFREICSKSAWVRHKFLATNFRQLPESERWNPLAVRG